MGNYALPRRLFPEDHSSGSFLEDHFSGKLSEEPSSGRRMWTSRRTRENVPEEVSFGSFPEKRVFRNTSFFFRKKVVLEVILFGFLKCCIFLIICF